MRGFYELCMDNKSTSEHNVRFINDIVPPWMKNV